eukprot:m.109160 g.109160  ORF g.109160 m.109160 type:complete len:580 (-) comp9291_c0_seq1:22-1761(-)
MPSPKTIDVLVSTMDAEIEFAIDAKATGEELFQQVLKTIGLRESWYFDICYTDTSGLVQWVKRHRKLKEQRKLPDQTPLPLRFLVKFFPEDVEEELIELKTQNLFYLQVKQLILEEEIFCPPEAAVLLASYAVQAKYGDYDPSIHRSGFLAEDNLLPPRVLRQYRMTPAMWESRIVSCYIEHTGMLREQAQMEYLKISQDLEMYGVSYFEIKNKRGTISFLGVDALGLNIYKRNDKLSPVISFPWSDVKNISFHDKTFTIKPMDSKADDFVFYASRLDVNKLVLQLCIGNHELYIRRRGEDSIEIQQMKAAALEEKQRRAQEQAQLHKERQLREAALRDKHKLATKLEKMKRQAAKAQRDLLRAEEHALMFQQKLERAGEEHAQLRHQAQQTQSELQQLLVDKTRTDEEKLHLQEQIERARREASQAAEQAEKRSQELQELAQQLEKARLNERRAKEELVALSTTPSLYSAASSTVPSETASVVDDSDRQFLRTSPTHAASAPASSLPLQPEHTVRTKQLRQQLQHLKSDMADLQLKDNMTEEDHLHAAKAESGETKFDTLRRIRQGSTRSRISFFEEL